MTPAAEPAREAGGCLRCGRPAPGTLRIAIWEEEEKGRLGARPVSLCRECHEAYFAGALTRTDVARLYHEAKGIEARGWIGRLDRDFLLDAVCLNCGVILEQAETGALADTVSCPSCAAVNRLRARGGRRLTAEIA